MEIKELKALTEELWRLRSEKQAKEAEMKVIQENIQIAETKILNVFEAAEIDRFDGEHCSVFTTQYSSVKMPQESDMREKFFEYLKAKGVFEQLITIHSQTLNAWYREEEKNGNYEIPGLEEAKVFTRLNVRKK